MKNSTKYKFVPLFKQIKVNRALVKAFDEYVCVGGYTATLVPPSCLKRGRVGWLCCAQGGHGICGDEDALE